MTKEPSKSYIEYHPDDCLRHSIYFILMSILTEIWASRWAIWQLLIRNIYINYKQSFLGFAWVLVFPLIAVLSSLFILPQKLTGVFPEQHYPKAIFIAIGIMYWQIFASVLSSCTRSLVDATDLISKVKFSRKSLVLSSCGNALIGAMLQWTILSAFMFCYMGNLSFYSVFWTVLLIPLTFLPLVFFSLSIGLFLSLSAGIARDFLSISTFISGFFLFITPIAYNISKDEIASAFIKCNPLYYLIVIPREMIINEYTLNDSVNYLFAIFAVTLALIFSLYIFHISEVRISERI